MKIFITGASGFIGSHVTKRLLEAGHEIVAGVRSLDQLPWLQTQSSIHVVHADLADHETLHRSLEGCDACVHIALGWGDTPVEMLRADTLATTVLLQSCIQHNVKKFVYTSSTAAVGNFLPRMDEGVKTSPIDLYGATKAASEAYVLGVEASSELNCAIIRPGYTFGNPAVVGGSIQPDDRFSKIVKSIEADEDIEINAGDGTQFIWVGDLANIYAAALHDKRSRQTYFALGRTFVSWEQVALEAKKLTDSNSQISLLGEPGASAIFDVAKLDAHFGIKPEAYPHIVEHIKYYLN